MKENDIYWFMFGEGLIQVLLQVISWLNRHCGRISKPYFWQPGNVYFMCNITEYVYCVYLYVILLCLHIKRGSGPAVAKFIFIAATTDLCCFTALWAVAVQTLPLNTDASVSLWATPFPFFCFSYNLLDGFKCCMREYLMLAVWKLLHTCVLSSVPHMSF